jgi:two-component system LytT family response regulator
VIRVAIVDDEPLARDTTRLVLAADADVEIVASVSGVDAPEALRRTAPDLVFLDVQMPGLDGFDVIAAVGPEAMPAIVFVTAHDRYAVKAFEVHALDYVLKPYDDRRLLAALARARHRLGAGAPRPSEQLAELLSDRERTRPRAERFFVRCRGRTEIVDAADVDWFEAADDYVELHVGAAVHVVRERLAELEQRLDPARFVRIHRSAIVNLARIRTIAPRFRGDADVVLTGGATVRLSRSRRRELMQRLSGSPRPADGSPQGR